VTPAGQSFADVVAVLMSGQVRADEAVPAQAGAVTDESTAAETETDTGKDATSAPPEGEVTEPLVLDKLEVSDVKDGAVLPPALPIGLVTGRATGPVPTITAPPQPAIRFDAGQSVARDGAGLPGTTLASVDLRAHEMMRYPVVNKPNTGLAEGESYAILIQESEMARNPKAIVATSEQAPIPTVGSDAQLRMETGGARVSSDPESVLVQGHLMQTAAGMHGSRRVDASMDGRPFDKALKVKPTSALTLSIPAPGPRALTPPSSESVMRGSVPGAAEQVPEGRNPRQDIVQPGPNITRQPTTARDQVTGSGLTILTGVNTLRIAPESAEAGRVPTGAEPEAANGRTPVPSHNTAEVGQKPVTPISWPSAEKLTVTQPSTEASSPKDRFRSAGQPSAQLASHSSHQQYSFSSTQINNSNLQTGLARAGVGPLSGGEGKGPAPAEIAVSEASALETAPEIMSGDVQVRGIGAVDSGQARTSLMARAIGQQLVEAMPRASDRAIEVALNPEELGRVRMSISPQDGGIMISIAAERPETLDLMRRHIDQLAQEYQRLGYDSVAFNFEQEGADTSDGRGNTQTPTGDILDGAGDTDDVAQTRQQLADPSRDGLDIRI